MGWMRVIGSDLVAQSRAQIKLLRLVCVFAPVMVCACQSGVDTTTAIELPQPRSLNGRVVKPQTSGAGYSVLLIGHAYGHWP